MITQWLNKNPEIPLSNLSATDKGKSGYHGKHREFGFGRILAAIKKGSIAKGDVILVEALDRISRESPPIIVELITSICNRGVEIVTLEDNVTYSSVTLADNAALLYILVGKIQQAHNYSLHLSRRVKASYASRRRLARSGEPIKTVAPIWIEPSTKGKLDPLMAAMVKDCIDLYLKGYGTRKVILELVDKHSHLATVHPTTLARWFSNRKILGQWKTSEGIIEGVYEPLIDTATFYQLQKEIKSRSRIGTRGAVYNIAGLVECGECGRRYHYRRKEYKGSVIVYGNCSNYLKRGRVACSNKKTLPYEFLEYVFNVTKSDALTKIAFDKVDSKKFEKLDILKSKLVEKTSEVNSVLDLLVGREHQQQILDRLDSLTKEQQQLEVEIANFESSIVDDDTIHARAASLDAVDSDPIVTRDLLFKYGFRITVNGDTIVSNTGQAGKQTFQLIRKHNVLKAYLVRYNMPEHTLDDFFEDGEFHHHPARNGYMAIDKTGLVAASEPNSTLEQFIEDFDRLKSAGCEIQPTLISLM